MHEHLQQQIESLSSLLEQSEREKEELRQSLSDTREQHERMEELLMEETEVRIRSELEPALRRGERVSEEMKRVAEEKDKELVQVHTDFAPVFQVLFHAALDAS